MPITVVKCTEIGCHEPAKAKVAARWEDGPFSELKTYGYACSAHAESVIATAERRPKPGHLSPGETVGGIGTYPLGRP